MFRSRKAVFKPSVYDSSWHRRRRLPRWVVILFTGIIIGAGGYWFVQSNYGPVRISAEESARITQEIEQLRQEHQTLQNSLSDANQHLESTQSLNQNIQGRFEKDKQTIASLQKQLELIKSALPPDPSGLPLALRGAKLTGSAGKVNYSILITKDSSIPDAEVQLEMQVAGAYRNRNMGYSQATPVKFTTQDFQQITGTLTLDKPTLTPRTATVIVRDSNNKIIAKRIFPVKLEITQPNDSE